MRLADFLRYILKPSGRVLPVPSTKNPPVLTSPRNEARRRLNELRGRLKIIEAEADLAKRRRE